MKNPNIEDLYRLSPVQEGMLFHTLREQGPDAGNAGDAAPYFEQFVLTYPRGVETDRLEHAWGKLIARHPILRTSFFWEEVEEPVQLVHRRAEMPFEHLDLRGVPAEERGRRLEAFLRQDRRRGFALDRAPLMRATIVPWEGEACRLVWSYHHLLLDGWSVGLLLQEISVLYDGGPAGAAPVFSPSRPFRDYIAWLRQQDLQAAEAYWRREMAGLREPFALGFDRQPGQPVAPGDAHLRASLALPEEATAAVAAFARQSRLTFHTLVEGAWALALSRCAADAAGAAGAADTAIGTRDVVFGNTVAGRPASLPGAATMVGCFINTLPVRVRVDPGRPLLPWLQELQAGQLELRRHEHSPLVEVRRWAGLPGGRALFDAILVFENAALLPEDEGEWFGFQRTNYPLTLQVWQGRALRLEAGFYRGRFAPEDVSRLLALVEMFLRSFLEAAPGARLADLPALTPADARQIAAWNETRVGYPLEQCLLCLHGAVAEQARRTPEAVAATCEGTSLTYRELEERANRLAGHLRRLGVGPEDRVGVALERSLDLSVALLAVLKAGGAYVPLEPTYPAERLAGMAEDAFCGVSAPVVLTHSRHLDRLPAQMGAQVVALDEIGEALAAESPEPPPALAAPDSLAYVLFTSGSTGRPKGAGNTHRGVLNRLLWMQEAYRLGPADRVLQKTPFSFDVSGWELWWPLLTGARLVYAAPGGHQDPAYLVRLMAEEGITTVHFVPSMLAVFLDEPGLDGLTALRRVVASGEALPPALVRRAFSRLPVGVEVHNLYGPTEAAIDVTAWACAAADESIPIGRPVANTRIHVLDSDLRPLPIGVPGELCIAGVQVGRGYLGKPELTAERFVPDLDGARLYRTGDLARWRPDGALEYLGRLDHQVKIRGVRIELGEIEAVLASLPGVREAVVQALPSGDDDPGGLRLVAYVVTGEEPAALRERLRAVLPEAMVPAAFVTLDALPLSPNGKVDRKALPAPGFTGESGGYVPPRDATEEALAEIWGALLKAERVGATDNFFALGGDSIKAVRLVSRINTRLSTGLRVQDVFQRPTVETLAGRIAEARVERSLSEERAAGLAEIERRRQAVLADERWRGRLPADAEDFFPLSGIEKGMVYYSLLLPDQPIYHDQYAYLLSIDDVEVFFRSLELLVGRHEILRTTFHLYDFPEPMKVVRRRIPLSWEVEDLRGLGTEEQHRRVGRHRAEDLRRKFTFDGELLWRLRLFRLEERLFAAVWTWHHATLDGWSNVVFWQEMNELCGRPDLGTLEALPPLASSYKDYVAITLGRGRSERTEAFWKETLAGAERNKLPFHRGTVRAGEVFGMRTAERLFGGELLGALRSRGRQLGTSLQALCLAGHVHLLRVTTGEADVVTGVVSHDRPGVPDGDRIIGCFLNTVPVRLRAVPGESGRSLAERVTRYLAAEKEHEIPLPDVAALVGVQQAGGNPFFDTLLNFTDFHAMEEVDENRLFRPDALTAPRAGLDLASSEMTNTLFDVEVSATLGRFGVRIKYSPRHFEPADVARAADLYARILEALARDPEAPLGVEALLSPAERDELVHRYNDTARAYPRERPLHGFFAEQAALRPDAGDAEAVVCGGRSITYGELERQANRLAHALVARGVRPGENVGICWERSVELAAGMLAILKAGAAYVPLEPSYPAARKGYIVRQSQVSRILADREYELQEGTARTAGTARTEGAAVEVLVIDPAELAGYPDTPPAIAPPRPEDLAYTIYTSGSTGNPKGVMIEHHSAANLIAWVNREFSVGTADRVLMLSSVCFDLSVYDLFGGLGAGAAVVVARREEIEDPAALLRLVVEQRVTFWDSVPSTLGLLVQYLEDADPGFRGADLRVAFLSGDWIPLSLPERARRFFPNLQVISLGGATEGTVWSIFRPIGELDPAWVSVPYGRPLDNNAFYVLDRHRELVPVGVAGDLYIGGRGVARGYSGEAIKTAAAFGPDPFSGIPGARLYRTGDLGRMMPHGEIEFLGRSDHQVKVRGFRVELGEIESQLGRCPGIREAVVLARPDRNGQKYLCAYVVGPAPEAVPANPEIQAYLARHLPDYMVPDVFVRLAELPLTANGKIDRAALPDPGAEEAGLAEEYVAPAGEVETALVEIWEEVLGKRGIGVRHDFFTLGGHSLSAIQVLTRVRSRFGVDLPLPAFFESPTVAGAGRVIARLLARGSGQDEAEAVILPGLTGEGRPERLPLSFAQERLWFLYRLDPASAAFKIGGTVRLDGRLFVPALAASIEEVLRRHEALRTRFREEQGKRFQIVDPFVPIGLPAVDLTGLPATVRESEAQRLIQAEMQRPFDLANDRLLRPLLVRLGEAGHIVHFTLHHIVGDGWSMGILLREMATLYSAFVSSRPSPLSPLPVQYPDFALWQRQWLTGERLEQQLAYWRRRLAGPLPVLELPAQRPRPSTPRFQGAAETVTVPRHLAAALADLGRAEGATPFMVLLAAFEALLHLYSGETDLLVGINVANRGRREIEDLIGFFVNNLALRTDLSGDPSFREAVRRLRDTSIEAFAHQDVPYEAVLEEVRPRRFGDDRSYAPLFQVMFVYQSFRGDLGVTGSGEGALPGVAMSGYPLPVRTANFDLTLTLNETAGDLLGLLVYDTDLFEPAFITRMVEHFRTLLEEVATDPDRPLSEIPIASENQARQLTSAFSEEL